MKSVFFTDTQSRLVPSAVIDSALRLPRLALHTMWCPFNSRVSEAMDGARLRALEGHYVSSKGPLRFCKGDEGVACRKRREKYFPKEGSLICPPDNEFSQKGNSKKLS